MAPKTSQAKQTREAGRTRSQTKRRSAATSSVCLRMPMRDRTEMIEAIKQGLPIDSLESLRQELDIPAEVMIRTIHVAGRTLARRRKEGRLHPDESERLLRIGLLFERATQVLGSTKQAREWFKLPKKALGGKTPLDYADTEPGAREVEDLLGRIEHGVFS